MITQVNQVFIGDVPTGGTITVTGYADGSNFYRDGRSNPSYDGEGYNVGPQVNGKTAVYNLTSYNGLPFFINDKFGSGSDRIVATFSFPIYSVSFDYEIFPNAQMANGSKVRPEDRATTPGWPDFTFKADGQVVFRTLGVMPGERGYPIPFTMSPNSAQRSGTDKNEYAPQFIGSSGTILFPNGVNKLEFIDWPPVIGLGNVQFSATPLSATATPEPASAVTWLLCAAAFGGLAFRGRRRAAPTV
jgi:hypothetical protein